jgi:hypothetical protein
VQWFTEIEDPRDGPALRHNLTEILVVAVCAILSGAQRYGQEWCTGSLMVGDVRRQVSADPVDRLAPVRRP